MEDHRTDGRLSDLSEKLSFLKDDGDGLNFITAQIEELCINCNSVITSEEIHDHLMLLCHSKGFPKHVGMLTKTLSILHPDFEAAPKFTNDKCITSSSRPFNLFYKCSENDPESPTTEGEKEMSMSDIVIELGYGCTFNTLHLREILSIFLPLTDVKLSKLVGTIARTCTGIEDAQNVHLTFCSALDISSSELTSLNSWNVDALVDSIKQLASRTNWAHVMEQLDHEGFYIPDERSFSLLMSIYVKACQDPFPLHAICGSVWRNSDGQLSFLRHAVAASPDTFTFAHCSRKLTHVDPLLSSECGNQAWFCLDLLEVLCQLAEMGHIIPVRSILDYPINKFPEILLIGIAQINTAYNFLHNDLFSTLFRAILKDSTKTSVIHHLWRSNPNLVLLGFVDAHFDPDMIFRMLDICQELMILSSVLEKTPFPFSIKLACIASRKEYINLERWLNDNLITYKDAFSKDCLKFLDEVLHDVANDAPNTSLEHSFASIINVYKETVAAFFKVLQDHHEHLASNSNEIFEELRRLHVSSNPQIQSVADTELLNPERSSGDIEAEANAYFHRLFSGQLTIDSIVQLLGRFKGSPEKRERLIFDCIVGNLFEEYRFFPQYPEKQLKLTAVLLGSLIKQQLVTHLTLGIALRGVLDALRKSVDSKMFMFGTTALEQFIDRLIEWPHYCNHILQISHLHGTHADLVSAVERALARVSSCQSDISNGGGDILSADQQQTSTPAPVETMEVDEPSWQLTSSSSQFGQQLSPSQHQQHQGFHDGRLKPPVTSSNNTKPVSSLAWQSSSIPAIVDSITSQKETTSQTLQSRSSQHSTIVASAVSSSHPFVLPSRSITSTGFGAALNIETLVAAAERRDTQIQSPASEVQDKILFMINNISTTNMDLKAKEFIKVLDEQHYPWFAQYMVMKRASIEPNFHDLYLKFLGKVNSVSLNDEIMKATYENCKVLLKSELIKSSSEERSLLKNLGSWLGKFTIGRNYVLLAIEINPKALIIEAYEKGLMIAVIPFTSKILEPCASSLAYRPPNPWTMAILGLLAEIYNLPNLKMNLKFDIEVLFKNLSVDMKVVEPTSLLKGRVRDVEGNPDFSNAGIIPTLSQVGVPAEAKSTSHVSNHPNVLAQYAAPLHLASNTIVEDDKAGDLIIPERVPSSQGSTQVVPLTNSPFRISQLINSNSDSYININPKLSSIGPQMKFQSIIQEAMNEAINEIVGSVVEKSVTIAIDTTIKLVLKDYAAESDDSVIYRAARLMVRTLAGSLAHVTCKDHLRVAFSKQLRNVLSSFNVIVDRAEQIIQIITTDHLDLGCAFIENVSSEKAVELIEGEIALQLASLRKQKEHSDPAYYGADTYAQNRVYDDFMRNIWQNQPSQNRNVVSTGPPSMGGGSTLKYAVPCAYGSNSGQQNMGSFPNSQIALEFSTLTQPLDLIHEDSDRGSMQILSASSAHVGANGGIYLSAETSSIAASFPAATSAELHTVTKELGAAVLPSSSSPGTEHLGNVVSESLLTTGDALDKYQQVVQKLESSFAKDRKDIDIQGVVAEVRDIILKSVSRDEAALAVAQKVFKALYDNSSSGIHIYLAILDAIRNVCKFCVKELTSWVIYSDEDRKFNKEIIIGLIRLELVNLAVYNVHLAKLMNGGRNKVATDFAISLVRTLLVHEPGYSAELYSVMDVLKKLAMNSEPPELQQLVEIGTTMEEKSRQSRDMKVLSATGDPAGFLEKITLWFEEWCLICDTPATNDTTYSHISQLQQNGWLKGDDLTDRLFHILTSLSVARSLSSENVVNPAPLSLHSSQHLQDLSFSPIDSYAKLVDLILKYFSVDQGSSKLSLLSKILSVTVRALHKDAEDKQSSFNPRPYFRMFVNWLLDLVSPDTVDVVNFQVLTSFANAFHALQPLKVPGWSFAWLELVGHRSFMPKILTSNSPKGWPFFQRLLVDLFKFMEPYLRNAEMEEQVQFLYKGTLRVLLVLLHDFPEFLCEYHFSFCDVIPPSCIQMRNVILSAFPRNMRLPIPSAPNLKIDLLAEINLSPRVLSDVDGALKAKQIKADVDDYLKTKSDGSFLSELKQRLLLSQSEASLAGTRYNVPLINSLVLYVGMQAIQQLQNKSTQPMAHNPPMNILLVSAAMDIFSSLIKNLDTEGRYLFINAVANQLRYPNNHTHYFSFVLLYLFTEMCEDTVQEIIQEQITRVLLERLIANRPQPWGLVITAIELVKNSQYGFWERAFTGCTPEIERLLDWISRSFSGLKPMDDGMVSAGIPNGNC